jgi:hypothetical protein
MKTQKDYNKIVNIAEDNEITILDYTFNYNGNMRGATGSVYYPVTEGEVQDRISEFEGDDKELLIYMAENYGELNREMIEGVDSSREALIELFFDSSVTREHEEEIRKHFSEDKYPIIDCVGGGRCFNSDFQGNVNPELSKEIREFES